MLILVKSKDLSIRSVTTFNDKAIVVAAILFINVMILHTEIEQYIFIWTFHTAAGIIILEILTDDGNCLKVFITI